MNKKEIPSEIDPQLDKAFALIIHDRNYKEALTICNQFIKAYPLSAGGFRMRALVHAHSNDFSQAVIDVSEAIKINPTEPYYFSSRGRWELTLKNFDQAVDDYTKTIELGNQQNFHYYDEMAFFFRAVALSRLGKFKEALLDAEKVRDDFLIYLPRLGKLTKTDLVKEAEARLTDRP